MKPSINGARKNNNYPIFVIVSLSVFFFGLFIYIENVTSMTEFSYFGVKNQENGGKKMIKEGELGSISFNSRTIVETQEKEDDYVEVQERENPVQEVIESAELSSVSINKDGLVKTQSELYGSGQTLERETSKSISKKQGKHKNPVENSIENRKSQSEQTLERENPKSVSKKQGNLKNPVEKSIEDTETSKSGSKKEGNSKNPLENPIEEGELSSFERVLEREGVKLAPEECDLFTGEWVFDNLTRPLYKENECQYLTKQVTCLRNGRKDARFQSWRWQPKDCTLPKFKARVLMEKLRGKRLMFVGDSLNRNQWESMVCLVQSVSPMEKKSFTKTGSLSVFKLEDYNATVEFYWAPFIVESNSDDPDLHSITNRIIMPESIEKHGKNWKNVDYLIFNSYIWWMNTGTMKVLRGSFDEGSTEYDEIDRPIAYERVLRTWSKWVENNVDHSRTTVFFNSMSPLHIRSLDWGNPHGIKCALENMPITNTSKSINVGTDHRMFVIAANVSRSMKNPAHFLKITSLSEYRIDAHTGIYTIRQGKILTDEMKADPATYADCIHWCLPGLPDTWNEFLYTRIISLS